MRLILFFDLPVGTPKERRAYTHFVKGIKKQGFYMLQFSVYVKMNMDQRSADSSVSQVKEILPKDGYIGVLMVTEKQFSSIQFILGQPDTDVINCEDRVVVI